MALLKVVLDQLYQLMVFETPSDHYFPRSLFRQNFGRPPKKKDNEHKSTMYISYERAFNLLLNDP